MKIITINNQSAQPKYKQIVLSVEMAIAEKRLKREDKLPSVNKVSLEFSISRDTVLLAYEELKKRGIIYAVLGKGYYVKSVEFTLEQRIFLLFDDNELRSLKHQNAVVVWLHWWFQIKPIKFQHLSVRRSALK